MYNPYLNNNTFQPTQFSFQPNYTMQNQQQSVKIYRVNGENGAKAFQLPPGSDALLLDETAPIVWFVQTDDAGYKTVMPYNITPFEKEPELSSKEVGDRLDAIDERLKKLEEALV